MTDAATISASTARADAPADWARALMDRQLWILGQIAEGGLEICRAIERQAAGQPAATGPSPEPAREVARGDVTLAYARVARAVRLTLMLQSKVIQALQALDTPGADRARGDAADDDSVPPASREDSPARVLRVVRRAAEAEHDDHREVERLVREAAERLDQDDIDADLLSRPIGEIIEHICAELGLDPDWPRLAEQAWTQADALRSATEKTVVFRWQEPEAPVRRPRRPEGSRRGACVDMGEAAD